MVYVFIDPEILVWATDLGITYRQPNNSVRTAVVGRECDLIKQVVHLYEHSLTMSASVKSHLNHSTACFLALKCDRYRNV